MLGLKSLLALLALLELAAEGEAQENVKMCGRDLIRHAVSYCGNSRLKRATLRMEAPNHGGGLAEDASSGPAPAPSQPEGREVSGEGEDLVSLMSRWLPLSARERRTALMISDLCCQKGCSRKELLQFC